MNNRIEELAEQAGFSFKYKTAPNELNPGHTRQDLEKFAELIVRECAGLCTQHSQTILKFSQFGSNSAADCAEIIKSHFGVE